MAKNQGDATWDRWIRADKKEKEREAKEAEKRLKEILKKNSKKNYQTISSRENEKEGYEKFLEDEPKKTNISIKEMEQKFKIIYSTINKLNEEAKELRKNFYPKNEREILERIIDALDTKYLEAVYFPFCVSETDISLHKVRQRTNSLSIFNNNIFYFYEYSWAANIPKDWDTPEKYNLTLQEHLFGINAINNAINEFRNSEIVMALSIDNPILVLAKTFCNLWDEYIQFFWDYYGIPIKLENIEKFANRSSFDSQFFLEAEKAYFENRFRIKKIFEFKETLDKEKKDKEQEAQLLNSLVEDNDDIEETISGTSGFVYFIRNGDIYKIGITQNMLKRMDQLQPDELLDSVRCPNYRELEKEIHKEFKDCRIPQTEYFRLNNKQISQVHQMLKDKAL